MKNVLCISVTFLFLLQTLIAQEKYSGIAGYGPDGISIQLNGSIMNNTMPLGKNKWIGIHIYRTDEKTNQTERITLKPLSFPSTVDELKKKSGKLWQLWFKIIQTENEKELWQKLISIKEKIFLTLFLNAELAEISGLRFTDRNVKNGEQYNYKTVLINNEGIESEAIFSAQVTAGLKTILPPINVSVNGDENSAKINWESSPSEEAMFYNVFRSPDSTTGYSRINLLPIIITEPEDKDIITTGSYIDASLQSGSSYYYKLTASDHFGNISEATKPVKFAAVDTTSPGAPDSVFASAENEVIRIIWLNPQSELLKGFQVFRADSAQGEQELITKELVPPNSNFYDDGKIQPNKSYFYRIKSIKTNGKISDFSNLAFANWQVSTPPLAPKEIIGIADSTGIKISWSESESSFADGYFVYRSDFFDSPRSLVSPLLKDTVFTDTSAYISPNAVYWYTVQAVTSGGLEGIHSTPVSVNSGKQFIITAPTNFYGYSETDQIKLFWNPPLGDEANGYKIYKKSDDEKDFMLLWNQTIPDTVFQITDSTVESGKTYQYYITAISLTGGVGEQSPVVKINIPLFPLHPVETIRIYSDANGFLITWESNSTQKDVSYLLYRRISEGESKLITKEPLTNETLFFHDKDLKEGKRYFYVVETISADGKQRAKSDEVYAVFKRYESKK